MTELTDNELIARFMGFTFAYEREGERILYVPKGEDLKYKAFKLALRSLKYDTSWDWLMHVVEKIENEIFQVSIHTAYTNICGELNGVKYNQDSCFESQEDTKLTVTFRAVVKFIKWYNSNPQTP